jgi:hypothetical protein
MKRLALLLAASLVFVQPLISQEDCRGLIYIWSAKCKEAKKHRFVKIEIVAESEDRAFRSDRGVIVGKRMSDVVFMVNAVIEGDHARLKCFENHVGCVALGPGTYDAEISRDNVWITIRMPVTHEVIRNHWKVSGMW